ncbi:cytochrome P450 1A1-like [Ostrea edulis]|uniref:cytochrome P450 1A1-like n=1 Tax=Ostrea edulis TaxID=37623 RepID=UPI0024AFDA59|nr:cytochrome P450 1A1-like [Ostrea edulis]XP_048754986.2 cytochrome P450 1A1-like [Ostrea edulis]
MWLDLQSVLVGLATGLFVYYVIYRYRYRLPPGPFALPVIGNYTVYTNPLYHREVYKLSKQYGPVLRLQFGPKMFVFLNDLDTIMEALVKRKTDIAGRPSMKSLQIISEEKTISFGSYCHSWKMHRKVANLALRHFLQSTMMDDTIQRTLTKFMDKMASEKQPFAVKDYLNKIQFHIIYNLCMGTNTDEEIERFIQRIDDINSTFGGGFIEDVYPLIGKLWPSKKFCKYVKLVEEFLAVFYKKLEDHRTEFNENDVRDLMDQLLLSNKKAEESQDSDMILEDTRIVQTIVAIFYAGVDTTRITMDWFVCFMSGLPDIQEKCRQEIESVLGTRRPSVRDRASLPYIEACLYETLRRASAFSLTIPHSTLCDTQVGGYDIPKETIVFPNMFALHMNPKYWENPEMFDPHRFISNDGNLETKVDGWLPFSAGLRTCLGEALAKSEMVTMCAYLLQRFEFRLPEGVDPNFSGVSGAFSATEVPAPYKIIVKDRFA